jgi:acyl phosphate:glycerol-3-phosphate acyltransferase
MLELGIKALLAYGLGSLMGALILGAFRGVDIRTQGSGNAGGTNALRTQGKLFALGVVVIDLGKGWLAAAVVPGLPLSFVGSAESVPPEWRVVACAMAAVIGHVYPVWWEFRGGKGAATLIGVLLGVAPGDLPMVLGVWLTVVILTGYVGLGTMLAVAAFPIVLATRSPISAPLMTFAIIMAVFVVYTHRSNIARMHAGHENRAKRLWLGSYTGSHRG